MNFLIPCLIDKINHNFFFSDFLFLVSLFCVSPQAQRAFCEIDISSIHLKFHMCVWHLNLIINCGIMDRTFLFNSQILDVVCCHISIQNEHKSDQRAVSLKNWFFCPFSFPEFERAIKFNIFIMFGH